jgi:hypothetical protein
MLGKKAGCAARAPRRPLRRRINASSGVFALAAAIGKAAKRRTVRSTASLTNVPVAFGQQRPGLSAGAGAAIRIRRYVRAGGSGSSIGPSAPWTAFEYKNCTGTRLLPVLPSTSWNTRCKCPSWPAAAIG